MKLQTQYRSHLILGDFRGHWVGRIYRPGARTPHTVMVRATEEEGRYVLQERAQRLIDALVQEKSLAEAGLQST